MARHSAISAQTANAAGSRRPGIEAWIPDSLPGRELSSRYKASSVVIDQGGPSRSAGSLRCSRWPLRHLRVHRDHDRVSVIGGHEPLKS